MLQTHTIEDAVERLLSAVGEDPTREGLRATPRRVAEMYRELFRGLHEDPLEVLTTGFAEDHHDPVMLRNIPFYSICEHHFIPFFGTAHLAYIPTGWVVGASQMVRALEVLTHRPQLQERLTRQMADALHRGLQADGVAVVISAEHLCMSMRGVQKPGTQVVTVATRGDFRNSGFTRQEFLQMVRQG